MASEQKSMKPAADAALAKAVATGFPISSASSSSRAAASASIKSAKRRSTFFLNDGDASLQRPSSNARRDEATARSASDSQPAGIVNRDRPFEGFVTCTLASL